MSDWTAEEEKAFAAIMEAGKLERLPAIRLYRRFRCDLAKSLKWATDDLGRRTARNEARTRGRQKKLALEEAKSI